MNLTTQSIFDRYEQVRGRFPTVAPRKSSQVLSSLIDIVEEVDAFVFDAFGVLNVGDALIPASN